ncbi:thiolase-like protein [Anoxybacillus vitaminiphilus]|uniref:Thiolase-like protein n=1 Tax=Paranoxybacillus vitaminiphilus TaxID=581036 RepID=A0A327YTT2_9BACL|nr:thiolase-like protein [Anoxybacillus vitaminiphilus]
MREVVIVEAVRTPVGKRNGVFREKHPVHLASVVLDEVVKRAGIEKHLSLEALAALKPVFKPDGVITAGMRAK